MTEGADEQVNPDPADMHRELVALVARPDASIEVAPNVAAVRALTGQIAEFNIRVTAVGAS